MKRRFVTPARLAVALSLSVVMLPLADLGGALADTVTSADKAATVTTRGEAPSAGRTARQVDAPIPMLHWEPCFSSGGQCAHVRVPLDYDHPQGATIRLDLTRRKAHPAPGQLKIGTLFVNPGGPGAPVADAVQPISNLLGPTIHQRFDVVGIEPRGIGGSPIARCHIAKRAPAGLRRAFPMTSAEIRTVVRFNRYEREACRRGGSAIIDHMTTADTARDMDLIRQAVGDDQLTFYGISYGTYLGATYARLFPGRVRAIITDGVLDPVAWSTGRNGNGRRLPFSTRLRSGHGAAEALLSAFRVCDHVGVRRCAFAHNAAGKWRSMTNRLRQSPVRLTDGTRFHYADLVDGVLGALYSRSSYAPVMRDLRFFWNHFPTRRVAAKYGSETDPALTQVLRRIEQRQRDLPWGYGDGRVAGYGPTFFPMFEGVACADSVNPRHPDAWARAANQSERTGQPWFGRDWTWASSVCSNWPGSSADAYRGPWRTTTSTPVLIVGNTHDPATPIGGARALHRVFGNSRLVTMNGWGHGAIGESQCVTRAFSAYLLHQTLPPGGKVCRQDRPIFPHR
jgi:pimeloyl-ACP methyl ester carboxylesterase